jgi:hypothetical protein
MSVSCDNVVLTVQRDSKCGGGGGGFWTGGILLPHPHLRDTAQAVLASNLCPGYPRWAVPHDFTGNFSPARTSLQLSCSYILYVVYNGKVLF